MGVSFDILLQFVSEVVLYFEQTADSGNEEVAQDLYDRGNELLTNAGR